MESILVVDDNMANIQFLGGILSEYNYAVEFAQNGKIAVELVKCFKFDLVLMDVMMPEMDGYRACELIKQIRPESKVPVIFITAKTDADSIARGFAVGGADYITKPFKPAELIARVNTHLSLRARDNELKELNRTLDSKVRERTGKLSVVNENLKKAYAELEMFDFAKTEFLRIISQEIREPLNGIIDFVNVLKNRLDDKFLTETVNALDISCSRLEDFSNTAYKISLLNTKNASVLKKKTIRIDDTIKDIISDLQLKKSGMNLIVSLEQCEINCDVNYFAECLKIILLNALSHSPKGGKIHVKGIKKKEEYSLIVQDSGPGFTDDMLVKGVKPFMATNHIDNNPGLDLYLCKLIIEIHGGSIRLANENGGRVELCMLRNSMLPSNIN